MGNNEEFENLLIHSKVFDFKGNLYDTLCGAFKKTTFIVTKGDKPTSIIDNRFPEIITEVIDVKNIQSTNGAGDAFAAGFMKVLSESSANADDRYPRDALEEAVAFGHRVASKILQIQSTNFSSQEKFLKFMV
jgi:sugar/nucleoside kinase (ribokinase family)